MIKLSGQQIKRCNVSSQFLVIPKREQRTFGVLLVNMTNPKLLQDAIEKMQTDQQETMEILKTLLQRMNRMEEESRANRHYRAGPSTINDITIIEPTQGKNY